MDGDKPKRQKFKRYPMGYFHIDIAEWRTNEGKRYLFVAIDRTSKFAVAQLVDKANRKTVWEFLVGWLGQLCSCLCGCLEKMEGNHEGKSAFQRFLFRIYG